VIEVDHEIHLHRECPDHGEFAAVINSDSKYYYLSVGADSRQSQGAAISTAPSLPVVSGAGQGCCSGGACGTSAEDLSTCIGLIEIVRSCNLSCPVCFADSPQARDVDALPFDEFVSRVEAVIRRKGSIDILQLSGGEPTIHPEFFRLLEWALANPQVGHVLLNTNGIKLTGDRFFSELAAMRAKYGKLEIYLQFDGPQERGQIELRGVDLRQTRQTVIERAQSAAIPVNLAMTVDEHNRDRLGDALRLALRYPWVVGVTWQPMFGSGRVYDGFNQGHQNHGLVQLAAVDQAHEGIQWAPVRRLNVADIIHGVVAQSEGLLSERDFTPLPCGDPNCHTVGYLIRRGDQLLGLSSLIDLGSMQGFLRDRMNYNVEDLLQCGCESEPLAAMLKQFEIGPQSILRLVIKPFMDAWTYDQHRVDRCCVHVIGPGGSLESFCRHYAMA
jgi:uncharacterized radical SAM superfamily Fe-S cluster-containing enzyme